MRYKVKAGDTLWSIARATLGQATQWPRIWRYNNRADVIGVTGRGIPNPDLIYPNQILLIPTLPAQPPPTGGAPVAPQLPPMSPSRPMLSPPPPLKTVPQSGQPPHKTGDGAPPPNRSLTDELNNLKSPISIKYRLDDLKFPPIVQPGCIMEMRMTGDVLLMTQKAYPAVYVTQRKEIEAQVVSQANTAFGSLVNDTRLIYDTQKNVLTYRSMLVVQGNGSNVPSTAIGVQMDSKNPIPKLRFEFRFPKLAGSLPLFNFTALDVKVVVELTPTPLPPSGPSAQPVRAPEPSVNWDKVLGVGLVTAGAVLVVGTLVEDFFTAGAGTIDDPASFAAAGASVARGLAMMRGAALVLPRAAVSAAMTLSVQLAPSQMALGVVK